MFAELSSSAFIDSIMAGRRGRSRTRVGLSLNTDNVRTIVETVAMPTDQLHQIHNDAPDAGEVSGTGSRPKQRSTRGRARSRSTIVIGIFPKIGLPLNCVQNSDFWEWICHLQPLIGLC